ncbi:MAG TPA: glycosyltransferase family 2 protein [Gemmatimonadales bacterium]|nr:glycosyltransferase family 2 protein [Gemmatimonadales bacterium]
MPCLNEAASVGHCVRAALEALAAAGLEGEVVVADNGSTDGSPDIAREAGARVVEVPVRGYGAAYLAGLAAARGRLLVLADADGTYPLEEVPAFVAKLREGNDVVIGSRFAGRIMPGSMPWLHRYVGNPILTRLLGLFFGRRVSDAHCGMRALTREANEALRLRTTGMEYASEMIAMAIRRGLKLAEIPITYRPRAGESKLRSFRDGWRHLRFMLLLSPTPLFLVPGLISVVAGLVMLAVLLPGPVVIGGVRFDFHFMFVASALAILGVQLMGLGLAAKLAARAELAQDDRWVLFLDRWFTLERGLLTGGALAAAGLGVNVMILVDWLRAGRTALFAVRPALVGLTLLVIGTQVVFGSFFLSVVRDDARG